MGFVWGLRYTRWNAIILSPHIICSYEELPTRAALGSEARLGR
jgi:hypothetical protein